MCDRYWETRLSAKDRMTQTELTVLELGSIVFLDIIPFSWLRIPGWQFFFSLFQLLNPYLAFTSFRIPQDFLIHQVSRSIDLGDNQSWNNQKVSLIRFKNLEVAVSFAINTRTASNRESVYVSIPETESNLDCVWFAILLRLLQYKASSHSQTSFVYSIEIHSGFPVFTVSFLTSFGSEDVTWHFSYIVLQVQGGYQGLHIM